MKHGIMVALLSVASMATWAGEKIDKTVPANADGYVEIEHVNGYVELIGWDNNSVKVTGELDDNADHYVFEQDGNQVVFKVKYPKGRSSMKRSKGDDLRIFVPKGSRLSYTSTNAHIDVSGIHNSAEINTVNGMIEATDLTGRIHLNSVNGQIKAMKLDGNVVIETVNGAIHSDNGKGEHDSYHSVNGSIYVTSASPDIKVETVNGKMKLKLGAVQQLRANTVNGRMNASLSLLPGGEVDASSVGGAIELNFAADVSARFNIETHAGGDIDNGLTKDKVQRAKYGPSRWLNFTAGSGNGRVKISTLNGEVRLGRQ